MTVSIFDVLAILPSGQPGATLSNDELGRYLAQNYNTEAEKDRNNRHALRDELYHDGGVEHMRNIVNDVFQDNEVRKLRQKWVRYARFNNATKRIVNELSTVYSEPAKRLVGKPKDPDADPDAGDEAPGAETDEPIENRIAPPDPENDKYQELLEAVRMDERAVEINRLLNLHRALLVGFRVRQKPDGEREPVIDVATPANVRAVMHPNDETEVVAWLIRTCHKPARKQINTPAWVLWTDHESIQLRDDMTVIGDSIQEHGLGLCPWIAITLGPPGAGFWPGQEGEDLTAAHIAIWFNNVLLLKESKSATKQTFVTGDGTGTGRGQSMDSEAPAELADGQTASTVDMSMDLSMFRDTTDHVLYNTAHNYGMSPAIVDHQGVQSAAARELMRLPLKEIRRQQQVPLRRFERQLATVMARVIEVDLPKMKFDPEGWRIEFAESETPLDPMTEFQLFEKLRGAGLSNSVEFYQRKRPGIEPDDALMAISNNILIEVERNRLMRPLQEISGSLGAAIDAAEAGVKVTEMIDASGAPTKPGAPPVQAQNSTAPAASSAVIVAGNPWRIEQRAGKYLVVKSDTGKVVGTHDTLEAAKAQLAALHANVKT